MSRLTLRRATLFTGAALLACSALVPLAAQQSAAAAPPFDATFDVNGSTYSGGTSFVVDKAGKVSGTMKLDSPALVNAKLNGEVKDGVWTFNYPFTMDNQGQACSGTVSGTAKVKADGSEAAGSVTIGGDCGPEALTGTFLFKKRAK